MRIADEFTEAPIDTAKCWVCWLWRIDRNATRIGETDEGITRGVCDDCRGSVANLRYPEGTCYYCTRTAPVIPLRDTADGQYHPICRACFRDWANDPTPDLRDKHTDYARAAQCHQASMH